MAAEVPSLHPSIQDRMSSVISRALRSRALDIFHNCPPPDACWGGNNGAQNAPQSPGLRCPVPVLPRLTLTRMSLGFSSS